MSWKILSFIPIASLLVFSCSENGSPVASNGVNRPSTAPSTADLMVNYHAAVNDSQVSADLTQVAALGSLSAVLTTVESAAPSIPSIGSSTVLGKKTVAASVCQSFEADTSYVLGIDTIDTYMHMERNGATYQLCIDNTSLTSFQQGNTAVQLVILGNILSGMDGVSAVSRISSTSIAQKSLLNAESSISVATDQTGAIQTFNVSMDAAISVDVLQPHPWNLYAEFSLNVSTNVTQLYAQQDASSGALQITGSATIYLQDGRYQCAMNYTGASETARCDLMHNGLKVGSLVQAPGGSLEVRNADNEVIDGGLPVIEIAPTI